MNNDTALHDALQAASYGLGVELQTPNGAGDYNVLRAVAPLGTMPAPMPICAGTRKHDQPAWFKFIKWIGGF